MLQCDLTNIVVQVAPSETNTLLVWAPAIIGALAAIVGATVGAFIGVRHSRRTRDADEKRHLKERFAELIHRMDNTLGISDGYRHDGDAYRQQKNPDSTEEIFVDFRPATVRNANKQALTQVSAVLGYLTLVAPADQVSAAQKASSKVRNVTEVLESEEKFLSRRGFWEHDYDRASNAYKASRDDLLVSIQSRPAKKKLHVPH